jgi:beta-galactosidase
VETTGKAVALELIPDRKSLSGDGRDAMPITVRALDAKGRAVPTDNSEVTFDISGAGKSIGHGNGDPNSHEDEKGKTRKLFNGLAQLIVQSNFPDERRAGKGDVKISARSPGLKTAVVNIPVKNISAIPFVAESVAPNTYLTDWRISPASAERPNPTQVLADNDMNTWGWGQPPMVNIPADVINGKYRLYRTHFTPRKNLVNGSGRIHFYGITGKAEIWLNGVLIAKKDSYAPSEINPEIPAGEGPRQLNVIVEGEGDKKAGIEGNVVIEPKN